MSKITLPTLPEGDAEGRFGQKFWRKCQIINYAIAAVEADRAARTDDLTLEDRCHIDLEGCRPAKAARADAPVDPERRPPFEVCPACKGSGELSAAAPAEPVGMTPKEFAERVKRGEKWEVVPPAEPEREAAWMARRYDEAADLWEWDAYTVEMYEKRKDDGRYYEWTPLFTHPHRSDAWVERAMELADEYADEAVMHASASAGNALAARAALLNHLKGE